jgi:hypothetical protein
LSTSSEYCHLLYAFAGSRLSAEVLSLADVSVLVESLELFELSLEPHDENNPAANSRVNTRFIL